MQIVSDKDEIYLGHIISEKGVAVDLDKISCVNDWPTTSLCQRSNAFLVLPVSKEGLRKT